MQTHQSNSALCFALLSPSGAAVSDASTLLFTTKPHQMKIIQDSCDLKVHVVVAFQFGFQRTSCVENLIKQLSDVLLTLLFKRDTDNYDVVVY